MSDDRLRDGLSAAAQAAISDLPDEEQALLAELMALEAEETLR